jgi:hypothetical protein
VRFGRSTGAQLGPAATWSNLMNRLDSYTPRRLLAGRLKFFDRERDDLSSDLDCFLEPSTDRRPHLGIRADLDQSPARGRLSGPELDGLARSVSSGRHADAAIRSVRQARASACAMRQGILLVGVNPSDLALGYRFPSW